jgi:hypothetical protein
MSKSWVDLVEGLHGERTEPGDILPLLGRRSDNGRLASVGEEFPSKPREVVLIWCKLVGQLVFVVCEAPLPSAPSTRVLQCVLCTEQGHFIRDWYEKQATQRVSEGFV